MTEVRIDFRSDTTILALVISLVAGLMFGWFTAEEIRSLFTSRSPYIERECSGRYAWFCEINRSSDGYLLLALTSVLVAVCLYWAFVNLRRILSPGWAVFFRDGHLYFHSTIYPHGPVALDRVVSVWLNFPVSKKIYYTSGFGWRRDRTMWIVVLDADDQHKKIYVDANFIVGGRLKLIEFKKGLNRILTRRGNDHPT